MIASLRRLIICRALGSINSKRASPVPEVASGATQGFTGRASIGRNYWDHCALVHADMVRLERASWNSWPLEIPYGCPTTGIGFGGRCCRHARRRCCAPGQQVLAPPHEGPAGGLRRPFEIRHGRPESANAERESDRRNSARQRPLKFKTETARESVARCERKSASGCEPCTRHGSSKSFPKICAD